MLLVFERFFFVYSENFFSTWPSQADAARGAFSSRRAPPKSLDLALPAG